MRLITYLNESEEGIGSLEEDNIIPFSQDQDIPNNMLAFLEGGEEVLNIAKKLCEQTKKKMGVIIKELEKASKMHKGQADRLSTILSVLKSSEKNGW